MLWTLRSEFLTEPLRKILENPEAAVNSPVGRLKADKATTVTLSGSFVIKRYQPAGPVKWIEEQFRVPRARQAFRRACLLETKGIPTAAPVAAAGRWSLWGRSCSYFVSLRIPDAAELQRWSGNRREAIRHLAGMIARVHEQGFSHRDLKPENILLGSHGDPFLIDMDGLRRHRRVSTARAIRDLLVLARDLPRVNPAVSEAEKRMFAKHYSSLRRTGEVRHWGSRLYSAWRRAHRPRRRPYPATRAIVEKRTREDVLPPEFQGLSDFSYLGSLGENFFAENHVVQQGRSRYVLKISRFRSGRLNFFTEYLCRREINNYAAAEGIHGIPKIVRPVGRRGFLHEFVPGKTLKALRQEAGPLASLPAEYFDQLEEMIHELHRRDIAYVDMSKSENILITDSQQPALIDFQISFRPTGRLWKFLSAPLLRTLCEADRYHLRKHRRRFETSGSLERKPRVRPPLALRLFSWFIGRPFLFCKRIFFPKGSDDVFRFSKTWRQRRAERR